MDYPKYELGGKNFRWGSLVLRSNCSSCGQPLPLAHLAEVLPCPYCQAEEDIPRTLWHQLVLMLDELTDRGLSREGTLSSGAREIVYKAGPAEPVCEKCGARYPEEAADADSPRNFRCSCGDPAGAAPVPDWLLKEVGPARVVVSVDPLPEAAALEAVSGPAEAPQLIAMGCPRCGGGLEVTKESGRLFKCRFCGVDIYMPDEIWRRLHPVKKVQPLYFGFSGKSLWRQEQEREAAEQDLLRQEQEQDHLRNQELLEAARRTLLERTAFAKARAWQAVFVHGGLMLIAVAATWLGAPGGGLATGFLVCGGIIVVLATLVTCGFVTRPLGLATGYPGEWQLFATWFWIPFALMMPVVGQVMALFRVIILARGRFGAATISSGSSSTSYEAVALQNGEGRPAAVFFLSLTLLWPALLMAVATPKDAAVILSSIGLS